MLERDDFPATAFHAERLEGSSPFHWNARVPRNVAERK